MPPFFHSRDVSELSRKTPKSCNCMPTERVIPGGSLCVRAIADIVPCIGIRIEPSDYQVAIGEHDIFTGVGSQWGRSHLLPG